MKLKYYHNLDGLRAIAAIAVIVTHFFTRASLTGHSILFALAQQGSSGVSLFFVLSGFVITRILITTVDEKKYFFNFYVKRCLRIFPLYYLALLCYRYIPYLFHIESSVDQTWHYYLYLQNIARTFRWDAHGPEHFWSLAVEEHFYLIWPAMVYFALKFKNNLLIWISVFLVFLSLFLRFIMLKQGFEINAFTPTRIDQLALGAILAILEVKNLLKREYKNLFLLLMVAGVILVGCTATLNYFYLNLLKHDAYGILYFGLIGFCIVSDKPSYFNKFLTHPVMQFLGRISYGIYVWHVLAIMLLKRYFSVGNLAVDFIIICIATVAISSLSYYLMEVKFLKLKKYLHQNEFKETLKA